jgi:hypothetical protein
MKTLFLAILLLASALPGRAEDLGQEIEPLLQGIRAALPKGWTVKFAKETLVPVKLTRIETDKFGKKVEVEREELWDLNREGFWLLMIERDEPVACGSALDSTNGATETKMEQYSFGFSVGDFVTFGQHQQGTAENAEIQKKADVIYDDFARRRQLNKGATLWAKTDADKVAVARYDELIKSKHDLPDFYFQKASLWWQWGSPQGFAPSYVKDDRQRAECEQAREKVLKMLSKYPEP